MILFIEAETAMFLCSAMPYAVAFLIHRLLEDALVKAVVLSLRYEEMNTLEYVDKS